MREKLLVLAVSGIGNTILQSPLIRALVESDRFEVDILFGSRAATQVFADCNDIRHTYVLPSSWRARLALLLELHARHYDVSIAAFPSNRIEFHVFAFVVGARVRVAHSYSTSALRTLAFLSNRKIPAQREIHDVEQNLALLTALGIPPETAERRLAFTVGTLNRRTAHDWLHARGLTEHRCVGIHAGSKVSERYRRWPREHFVELIDGLNDAGLTCLLFAGPEELADTRQIYSSLASPEGNALVTDMSLGDVAALIERCVLFLSTDSGLGHVAAAVGVETFAIFGPAQWTRTAPYGPAGHHIALNLSCSPCLRYPFDATHSRIDCPYTFRCLRDLAPAKVLEALLGAMR